MLLASAGSAHAEPLAQDSFEAVPFQSKPDGGQGFNGPWKASARKTASPIKDGLTFELPNKTLGSQGAVRIRGFDDRDNPLRRQLNQAHSGDELFVRFLLRYDAQAIDIAEQKSKRNEGEFFVLWLDDIDGSDGATHNTNVPNIGVHVSTSGPQKGKNLFMVRIGSNRQAFTSVELQGNQTYLVVGRLKKSMAGSRHEYDTFSIWVNPQPKDKPKPLATSRSPRGLNLVRWIGFATGRKTELDDQITIDEVAIGATWENVLELPEVDSLPSQELAKVDFGRHVLPILQRRCFDCHQGAQPDSGVRLDLRDELLGHSTGKAVVIPGKSSQSPLIALVTAPKNDDDRMPPDGERLPKSEVQILASWIDQGAAWDESLLPSPPVRSDHWAFQPVKRPARHTTDSQWVRNPIDAFIAAGHQSLGLAPAPEASRRKLLKRLSFDLTGLPPKPADVDAFAETEGESAYLQAVNQLLDSPAYGERWGRHWLDVARWAESNGHQHNSIRHHSWRYRDYVVRSFNDDKPYDQFLREQIAGDQLDTYSDDHLIATGFLAAARVSGNQMDKDIQRNDILVDMVNATASSVLGLTMQCAQCHNHKFDPISARDYYQFQAFFAKGQLGNLVLKDAAAKADPQRRQNPPAHPQSFGFYAPGHSPHQVTRLKMRDIKYPLTYQPDRLAKEQTYLLVRGDVDQRGPVVEPAWPAVFGEVSNQQQIKDRPRLALANWLVSRDHPLTARVWVNRIWHYHFGRGLVPHPNDFGVRTASPVQRDLLDWLAVELMESGWKTKHIHRLIVTSNTYRQSSRYDPQAANLDPDNAYYWRWSPRRLEAEAIRDAALAVSGELDLTRGGPSIMPDAKPQQLRRTIYLQQRRQRLPRIQTLFDGAGGLVSCGQRRVSTVALQPLYLLNNPFMLQRAKAFALRVEQAHETPASKVNQAFRLALGRAPDDEELSMAATFLVAAETDGNDSALLQLCHALLNLNEFVYLD